MNCEDAFRPLLSTSSFATCPRLLVTNTIYRTKLKHGWGVNAGNYPTVYRVATMMDENEPIQITLTHVWGVDYGETAMLGVLIMERPPDRVCWVPSMGEKEPIPVPQTLKLKILQFTSLSQTE